ncbi:hypothetical protein [Polyangium mundeleinium]|uniref:Uncharacterized protein n=1 Tax=Polyangium mundeleinium TaxID=2995306 RepID=A0ABT5EFA8_9BACT|nr:hypothetical protein [Polyangium mundeleinium]MDC0740139.1 hypothetical protein [Polyangium mundeleinium]
MTHHSHTQPKIALVGIKELAGILEEIGATPAAQIASLAPKYVQALQTQAQRIQLPQVRRLATSTAASLSQIHKFSLERKMQRAVQPSLPITISWDGVPANTAGAQATMRAPYSGQPFRVTEIECLTQVPFRFTEFNIGGIDFAEPSRSRVTYDGAIGAVATANRGLDFPTIKARDKTRPIDANWSPWVNVDFTSDATITVTPFNYGTVTGAVLLTIYTRSNPCGNQFNKQAYYSGAAKAVAANAIMGASYINALDGIG